MEMGIDDWETPLQIKLFFWSLKLFGLFITLRGGLISKFCTRLQKTIEIREEEEKRRKKERMEGRKGGTAGRRKKENTTENKIKRRNK